MKCCDGHTMMHAEDPRFEDDAFTRDALRARRANTAHAHAGAFLLALVGGALFFGLLKSVHRNVR
jgi:hypothetical protein